MTKSKLLIPAVMLIHITGIGQTTAGEQNSGTARYDEKMKLEIKLEGESAQYSDMLPKEKTEKKVLYFTPEASVYMNNAETSNSETMEQESAGAMIQVRIENSDNVVYRNLKENKRTEQREFMSRMFLIESDAGKTDWKLTGGQKTILNFPCQEAIREDDGKKVRAWFSPAIPVPTGPQNFGNLPGLILSVDINDGKRIIMATSVDFSPVDKSLLAKPKKGKKVTEEEYKKLVDEKMKEMGAEGGSGQQMIIKIQR